MARRRAAARRPRFSAADVIRTPAMLLVGALLTICHRGRRLLHSVPVFVRPARNSLHFQPRARRASSMPRFALLDSAVDGARVRAALAYEFDDGYTPDSVDLNPALEFIVGRRDVARGLDEAVRGMVVGETKELAFGTDNPLFGARDEEAVVEVPLEVVRGRQVGDLVSAGDDHDGPTGVLRSVGPTSASVDLNHPLAGKGVSVRLTLLHCEEALVAGVRLQTIAPGDGKTYARYGEVVTLHCTSLAKDGSVVACSRDRGEPLRIRMGSGEKSADWEEGVARVSLGEKAAIRFPAKGLWDATLNLEVEILSIESDLEMAF
mmetsp:Transcript_17195/g.60010  ORF Transcript_17195/g.60010 Transcript_17195/m.60010 type:complete len:320 (-) Transcript_17195:330-1289(-)